MVANVERLAASSIPYTVKQFSKMIDNGSISFDNLVQRGLTWENKRRSEFIWSLIMNYPIPPIYAGRDINGDNKMLDIMDGKQRLTTIHKYLNDEFNLTSLNPIPYTDENGDVCEIDISNKKFSELDEEIQDLIKDRTITVYYYDNISQEQKRELFKRLNNGKALTAKNKSLASCVDLDTLMKIGSHELFTDMLTQKGLENKNQVTLVMKSWMMLNRDIDEISFESKKFNPVLEQVEISTAEENRLNEVFDLVLNTHTTLMNVYKDRVAKKLYTETHLISLIPFFNMAIEDERDEDDMAGFITYFYDIDDANVCECSRSEDYDNACTNGVARTENIIIRNNSIEEVWNEYWADIDSDANVA